MQTVDQRVLRRLAIRFACSLIGIAAGLLISDAVLSKFSLNATALVESTLLFWVIHLGVQLLALRVLVRRPLDCSRWLARPLVQRLSR